jgi:hypothetical protein
MYKKHICLQEQMQTIRLKNKLELKHDGAIGAISHLLCSPPDAEMIRVGALCGIGNCMIRRIMLINL